MISILLMLILPTAVSAKPSVSLPVNAQVPPVARANKPFSFAFAESTFTSSSGNLTYTLSGAPGWLHVDSLTRTFSGVPSLADVGSCVLTLDATDTTGTTSMPITFVVSTESGPGLGVPVSDQLATQTDFSSPNTLLIPHSSELLLSFSPNTFTNTNSSTAYYAISADHTPLPSWIKFSPNNLSLAGMTPLATSFAELPQTYSIAITASDVVGFAGATAVFQITVERHLFTFRNDMHVLNVSAGSQVSYNKLGGDLFLDGKPANSTDIAHVVTNAPSWLSINNQTLVVSGLPPVGVRKQNFTVAITDIYGESTATSVFVSPANDSMAPLLAPLGSVMANNGSDFQFDLRASLEDPEAAITVGLSSASNWLSFDPRNFVLMGKVPGNIMQQNITINVTAAHDLRTQTKILTIIIITSCVSATDSSACAANTSAAASPSIPSSGSRIEQDKRWIALVVVLPVFIIVLSLLLIFYLLRRRKLRREGWDTESSDSFRHGPAQSQTEKEGHHKEEVKMSGALGSHQSLSPPRNSKPPALDVPGFWKTVTTTGMNPRRLSKASSDNAHSLSRRGSWITFADRLNQPRSSAIPENGIVEEKTTSPKFQPQNRVSKVRANFPRFSISSSSSPVRRYSRNRQTRSNISFGSSALMSSQISGFGHGQSIKSRGSGGIMFSARGIGHGDGSGPPGYGSVRDSWRNFRLLKALASGDASTSSSELYGQYFPQPPHRALTPNRRERPSIRLVDPPSQDMSIDIPKPQTPDASRPSTAQRTDQLKRLQEFHRKRVLLKNAERALFTAGPSSSRVSSYGMKNPIAPIKHASNSKARLSPKRQSHASDLGLFTHVRPDDTTPMRHKHRKTLSEISDNSSHQSSTHRQRTPSPIKSSSSPEHKERQEQRRSMQSSSNFIPTRFPPLGRVSRQNSLMSDDFDSRWESASSDAASMDPYIYSRGLLRSRGTDLASSAGGPGSSPSRWTLHGPHDSQSESPVRRITGARRRLLGSSSRQSVDRFVQGVKNLNYGRGQKREGRDTPDEARAHTGEKDGEGEGEEEEEEVDDDDDDDDDDDEENEEQEEEEEEEEEERGRRRAHIRIGGTPRRAVPVGQGGRVRKGEPGNTSFRGDIRRIREGGEEGGGSAFV